MTTKNHIYSLRKGSRKTTCPHCGRHWCFKPYINNETGEILNLEVGRCDHEQSCQYHYTPQQYFKDHPQEDNRWKEFQQQKPSAKPVTTTPTHLDWHQTEFFDIGWAEAAMSRESTFSRWFMSLPFDEERKREVLAEYYVGGTSNAICRDNVNYGPATVFWMIDERMQVHDAKLIAYQTNGHRVQGWGNSMRSICQKSGKGPQLAETEKVLFGLHLLNRYPDKPVGIVESEKSALICACRWPMYIWMATGGCGNLQQEKLQPLMHRRVVVYPDSGELDKWRERMKHSKHPSYTVIDYLEQYPSNTDIADVLLQQLAKTVEEKTTTAPQPQQEDPCLADPMENDRQIWLQMKAANPSLQLLEDCFDLELAPREGPCPF